MQKVVLSLDVYDDNKCKKRVMKIVSSVQGVDNILLNAKDQKLTLIGNMDVIEAVKKLRKEFRTTVDTIGPAKEPEKPKKDEPKGLEARPYIVYVDPWHCHCY